MSATRHAPVPGHPGIFKRDGQYVVRSPHRKGRPSTFSTLKAALAEQGLRRGGAASASSEPFADYAPRWIERYEGRNQQGLDESTRDAYRDAIVRLAVPYFKRKPLARIDRPMVKRYIAHLRDDKGLSTASIQKYVAAVKVMFRELVDDGLLPVDPTQVRIVGKASSKPRKPKMIAPAVPAILAELSEAMRELFVLIAFTGLRIAEACGLQWRDLGHDENGRPVLTVERQVRVPSRTRPDRYKHHPKTAAGYRTIPLAAPVARMLVKRRAKVGGGPMEPIFATRNGTPYSTHNVRRALRKAAEDAGHPGVTPHMFRHTLGSLLYERGWTDVQVAAMLGHRDPNFTKRTYLHAVEYGDMGAISDAYGMGQE